MKKMGWGLGLAMSGMVLLASDALAQGTSSGSSTGSSTDSSGSMGAGSGASTSGTAAADSTDTPASANALQGKVEKFDRSKNTLTLSGSDKTLKLDSSTKVMKDGSQASLEDIKEGDQVRASYSGSGSTLKVKSIDIMSAGSMGSGTGTSGSSSTGAAPTSPGAGSSDTSGTKSPDSPSKSPDSPSSGQKSY